MQLVRVGAALHQRVAIAAAQRGMTLNKFIVKVLERESGKEAVV